jgi:hypothetical protein
MTKRGSTKKTRRSEEPSDSGGAITTAAGRSRRKSVLRSVSTWFMRPSVEKGSGIAASCGCAVDGFFLSR